MEPRKLDLGVDCLSSGCHGTLGARLAALNAIDNVASDFNVVVSKLANLSIVNAHDLILLGSTQAETGDQVEDEQDDAGAEERVGKARDRVSQLVTQLDIVVVDPATVNFGRAIQVRNVVAVGCVS